MAVHILEAELIGLGGERGGAGREGNKDDFLRSGPGNSGLVALPRRKEKLEGAEQMEKG